MTAPPRPRAPAQRADTALVTGFPRLLARGLALRGLNIDPDNQVVLLVPPGLEEPAARFVADLPASHRKRMRLLTGRLTDVDLGLAGGEVRALLRDTTLIFHAASEDQGPPKALRAENLKRLSGLIDLATEVRQLRRLVVFSTAFVSGDRAGTILEEELDAGQRLRTPFERAMFAVEQLAREVMPRVPISVVRPAALIGHSRTGESVGLTEGPNYLLQLLLRLPAEMPLLLPGTGGVPFNIVPIDYVVRAAWVIATAPEGAGRTFHLTDPNPVSARQAFDLLSDVVQRATPFAGGLPSRLFRRALRLSGAERLFPNKLALFDDLTRHVTYHCGGTLELLAGTDVVCPPFESYADTLIAWLADYERRWRPAEPTDGAAGGAGDGGAG